MKKMTFICMMAFCALVTQGQASLPPAYYVDSQRVDLGKVYINPDNMANINVVNGADPITKTNGKIYLQLKDRYDSFLTLSDVLRRHEPDFSAKKIIYIIDDKVIKDTAGVRIDPSFLLDVHAVSMSDVPYLDEGKLNMGIVIIGTTKKDTNPAKDKGTIMIRGSVAGK